MIKNDFLGPIISPTSKTMDSLKKHVAQYNLKVKDTGYGFMEVINDQLGILGLKPITRNDIYFAVSLCYMCYDDITEMINSLSNMGTEYIENIKRNDFPLGLYATAAVALLYDNIAIEVYRTDENDAVYCKGDPNDPIPTIRIGFMPSSYNPNLGQFVSLMKNESPRDLAYLRKKIEQEEDITNTFMELQISDLAHELVCNICQHYNQRLKLDAKYSWPLSALPLYKCCK